MFYVLFFCLELCNHLNLKTGVRIKLPGYFTLANNITSSPFSTKAYGAADVNKDNATSPQQSLQRCCKIYKPHPQQ